MKKFVILTIATAITIFSILQLYLIVIRSENITRIGACEYILLGDSHTHYINDRRIFNFSFPSSSYQLHEKFIKSVPLDGKKVVINVAPHNFSDQYHNRYFSKAHEEWRKRFFIDLPEAIKLYKFKVLPKASSLELFKSFGVVPSLHVGQKQDLSADRLKRTLTRHYGDSTFADTLEFNAFTRIISFLNKRDVEYTVVQMPHHPTYWKGVPSSILARYENIVSKIENQIRYKYVNERHYWDGDHILGLYQGLYLNAEILDEEFHVK